MKKAMVCLVSLAAAASVMSASTGCVTIKPNTFFQSESSVLSQNSEYSWDVSYSDDSMEESSEEESKDDFWDSVEPVDSVESFYQYFKACIDKRMEEVPVYFVNGFKMAHEEILQMGDFAYIESDTHFSYGDERQITYKITYYPGTRIADTYLSGDKSKLTEEEMTLYDKAVAVAEQAKQEPTQLRKELYIHDYIMNSCEYYTGEMKGEVKRFCTALGVFLDGKANCQGYSDAFYMLGTMCGFKIGKVSGTADDGSGSGGHSWNTIELDGRTYFVDVTWDDEAVETDEDIAYPLYIYFNVPAGILKANHEWNDLYVPETIVQDMDTNYYYCTEEYDKTHFGQYMATCDDALYTIINDIVNDGTKIHYKMIKNDGVSSDYTYVMEKFNTFWESTTTSPIKYMINVETLEDYTFIFFCVTS